MRDGERCNRVQYATRVSLGQRCLLLHCVVRFPVQLDVALALVLPPLRGVCFRELLLGSTTFSRCSASQVVNDEARGARAVLINRVEAI